MTDDKTAELAVNTIRTLSIDAANRDRFVLSNGHASMLLWSILHPTKTQAVDADYDRAGARRRARLSPLLADLLRCSSLGSVDSGLGIQGPGFVVSGLSLGGRTASRGLRATSRDLCP